ncbi:DNA primase [Ahrensia marina]|uniref:DNA primase n=1 Tax=Ahrensia marina TaxID=1514904 RepID=A0A0M9GMX1_9HYPH|nr:DNA primase [Ahrensia marina]KPB01206.1 DNA primase [Ahrensia marina]
MRFGQSFLDEIRDRVPISDVIQRYVTWDKKKTNTKRGDYWACCPIHGENTPSFHCEDKKGRYYCFGCGASGDHFRFLTELEGVSFPEAVERVAGMAGVAMPTPDPEAEKREEKRKTLYEYMDLAASYYEEQLQMQGGAAARAYLRDRGLSASTINKFRLGFAPNNRSGVKEFLASKGASKEQIEATGMVVHGEDIAVSYDRFRDRIMFPIEDQQGRIIAFGGRAMSADVPAKYLNSPETELFHKGDILFNFKRARSVQAKQGGTVIAVEGYMDVIALDQAGFENAVAPLGTALTENQLAKLWRATDEPVLCFDGDKAGLRAAFRGLEMALSELKPGKSVRFALLPDGQDPDDLVKKEGPAAFKDVLAAAKSAADMLWLRETGGQTFDTPERRAKLEQTMREVTNQIADESVRRHYAQDMRERVAMFFGTAPAGNNRTGSGKSNYGGGGYNRAKGGGLKGRIAVTSQLANSRLTKTGVVNVSDMPVREAALMSAIICHPDILVDSFDRFMSFEFDNKSLNDLRSAVIEAHGETAARLRADLVRHPALLAYTDVIAQVDRVVSRSRLWVFTEEAAFEDALSAFEQAVQLYQRARGLNRELKAAEDALALDGSEANWARFQDIQLQVRRTQGLDALVEGFGVSSGRPSRNF